MPLKARKNVFFKVSVIIYSQKLISKLSYFSQQDAESLRCKLKVKSRLVVAGGADELLRLPRLKRQLEGVTQRMLECAIVVRIKFDKESYTFYFKL